MKNSLSSVLLPHVPLLGLTSLSLAAPPCGFHLSSSTSSAMTLPYHPMASPLSRYSSSYSDNPDKLFRESRKNTSLIIHFIKQPLKVLRSKIHNLVLHNHYITHTLIFVLSWPSTSFIVRYFLFFSCHLLLSSCFSLSVDFFFDRSPPIYSKVHHVGISTI